jgi:ribosomal protein S18 acetylase RimI-like enzyme
VVVRPARDDDVDAVATLTYDAYVLDGFEQPASTYLSAMTDAKARLRDGELLVAELHGAVVGAVTFVVGGTPYANVAVPGEAEFRMLAVAPSARRNGAGLALVQQCIASAYERNCSVLRLSTRPEMAAARRMYERLGFVRTPDRDWAPDEPLLTYALDLGAHPDAAGPLEPPRICGACGRRMVVQVTPTGWTARCSVHGTRHSR